jgi:hypothetical protein
VASYIWLSAYAQGQIQAHLGLTCPNDFSIFAFREASLHKAILESFVILGGHLGIFHAHDVLGVGPTYTFW